MIKIALAVFRNLISSLLDMLCEAGGQTKFNNIGTNSRLQNTKLPIPSLVYGTLSTKSMMLL